MVQRRRFKLIQHRIRNAIMVFEQLAREIGAFFENLYTERINHRFMKRP
jgi:hypothetical protein